MPQNRPSTTLNFSCSLQSFSRLSSNYSVWSHANLCFFGCLTVLRLIAISVIADADVSQLGPMWVHIHEWAPFLSARLWNMLSRDSLLYAKAIISLCMNLFHPVLECLWSKSPLGTIYFWNDCQGFHCFHTCVWL